MIRMSVTVKKNLITPKLKSIQNQLKAIPVEAHKEFVKLTPIDTGNARKRTKLLGNKIIANYPYARRLDAGWSKQAPRGMIKPLKEWLKKRIKQIIRSKRYGS